MVGWLLPFKLRYKTLLLLYLYINVIGVRMTKVLLLLFIVVVSVANVCAQKTWNEYHESITNKILVRTTKAQVIKEVENFFKSEKKAVFSDLKVREDATVKGEKITVISFTILLTKRKYKLDCFPLPKYGEDLKDNDWVEVTKDTSQFVLQERGCSVELSDIKYDGYQQTMVTIHFNAKTDNIETYNNENKFVRCKLSELTSDLKNYLATKFKKR